MKLLLSALIFLIPFQTHALDWQESAQVNQLFRDAGITGTFVLYDVTAQRLVGHNQWRANARFVPASTFKIFNTLIGLSTGVVKNVDEILPYGGNPQPIMAWEKDMSLHDAIAISNVAIYQELARRIGPENMREGISKINYGNKEIGTDVDNFWLVGPLEISAIEQTQLLARLAQEALPFPKSHQAAVRDVIRIEQKNAYVLYGKTGWANFPGPGVGWWVGWVEKDGHLYAFALDIDIQQASDASKRIELGKASLKALGVY
ncbi:MAG: class D beta-lactamase [Gammaproteobacteria bacterium]|nr:class D beta-lactamase [Gammaproteobacteria bacterium]